MLLLEVFCHWQYSSTWGQHYRRIRWSCCICMSFWKLPPSNEYSPISIINLPAVIELPVGKQTWALFMSIFMQLFVSLCAGSKSQSALWNAITAGMGIKGKEQKVPLNDPRSPEEILADDLPAADEPDATEKTAIRFATVSLYHNKIIMIWFL